MLAPVTLIGSMLSGSFTPTEASAVAVVYCLPAASSTTAT
ncbi:MAG: TRAP transporter large permease subunit [Burkholderiaceae bacterium]